MRRTLLIFVSASALSGVCAPARAADHNLETLLEDSGCYVGTMSPGPAAQHGAFAQSPVVIGERSQRSRCASAPASSFRFSHARSAL